MGKDMKKRQLVRSQNDNFYKLITRQDIEKENKLKIYQHFKNISKHIKNFIEKNQYS